MVKFENGLEYLYIENSGDISVIFVLFNVGSYNENKKIAGISHFLEHVLFLGNTKYKTNQDIYGTVDNIGGIINGMTHQHFTGYYIKISNNYIDEAIELLGALVQNPCFRRHDIEKERNVVIEEINAIRNKPIKTAKELFETNLFGKHPLSNSIGGDEKSLERIDKENMMDYYNQYYCPSNCAVICVSKENPKSIVAKYFGEWTRNNGFETAKCSEIMFLKRPMEKCKRINGLRIITEYRDIAQDSLIIGFPLFGYNDPRRVGAEILNVIVAGMLTSRLFTRLRHTERLVYSINSMVQFYKSCGYLLILTSADSNAVIEVVKKIFEELDELCNKLVPPKELEKVKKNIKGVMDIKNENTLNLALFYAQCLLNCGKEEDIETIDKYLEAIENINNEELIEIAQEYINKDNCLIICVGKTKEKELREAL